MRSVHKFNLKIGSLTIPLSLYKAADETKSIAATEVTKINGKIYKVQRKSVAVLDDGSEVSIDKTQILKSYPKSNGDYAVFTKDEQSQLLKAGSSCEWTAIGVVSRAALNELSFQKDAMICSLQLDKKKELVNQRNLKWYAMLKAGLQDNVILCQTLYKNVEYPFAITNFGNDLLVRFLHYPDEIRNLDTPTLPRLNAEDVEKARAFMIQWNKPFESITLENKTEQKVIRLIESRGCDVETPVALIEEDNPFG